MAWQPTSSRTRLKMLLVTSTLILLCIAANHCSFLSEARTSLKVWGTVVVCCARLSSWSMHHSCSSMCSACVANSLLMEESRFKCAGCHTLQLDQVTATVLLPCLALAAAACSTCLLLVVVELCADPMIWAPAKVHTGGFNVAGAGASQTGGST